jgi:crotonobetainyl-CoA:carnitine CoA-transferase CaiB-like acyl-CoA transferase
VRNRAELNQLVEEWTIRHDAYEVMERLQNAGVAAGVVQNTKLLTEDRHLSARGFIVLVDHPELGKLHHGGMPLKLSATPGRVRSHAPMLGEHNDYVLGELLGLEKREIERLGHLGVFQ